MSHKTTYQICKEHPAFQTIRSMAESIKHPTKGKVFSNNNPSYNPNQIKYMNVKQTLQNIRDYIGKNRRVGHTTAMILGANNVDNVLVLAQTHSQARMLQKKIPRAEVASITNPACLEAKSKPLVLDNYTLWSIVNEALQEIERLEREVAEGGSSPRSCSLKIRRDLGIDAAVRRIILCLHPDLSECEIQSRGAIEIGDGRYMVSLDGRPVVLVELEGDDRFRLTIL